MKTQDFSTIGNISASPAQNKPEDEAKDFLPLYGTDYIELYVGNARQAAHYYKAAFGFQDLAYAGIETGLKDRCSYVLEQGKIKLVLTAPLTQDGEIAEHLRKHGDGVKVIALRVEDAYTAFEETVKRGAVPCLLPETITDIHGKVRRSGIHTYGDTIHLFIDRSFYHGAFLPGYERYQSDYHPYPTGLRYIDHVEGNVEAGAMNRWATFYEKTLGFSAHPGLDGSEEFSKRDAIVSTVVSNDTGIIKFPLNEPSKGKSKSQVEEYLDFYGGAGCQHVALSTDDIIYTVSEMKRRGVEFIKVPDGYYDKISERIGDIKEDTEELKKLGIMLDRDKDGYLLQIFTKPVEDRPTLFFEVIQRKGARSFGRGNFQALLKSIKIEQARRGSL